MGCFEEQKKLHILLDGKGFFAIKLKLYRDEWDSNQLERTID